MRAIVHLDADAFFVSVEQAADPRLRGKPVAVGGEKRGIIASASYEARKMGVYTPMPSAMARRLCPKLILLPGDFEKYELFSRLMFSYAYDFTPDVEIGSIDEGYLDLTGTRKPAVDIAERIRLAIRQALKLSVSEGVASNKLVSQIASKLKKPSAFEFVPPGDEAGYLSPLPNKWLPGIGPKTATQLNSAGLAHIGQIAQTPAELLGLLVGRMAPQLREFARGIDPRPVVPVRAPAKSYGEQETFAADTTDEPFLEATLRRMADKLMAKVREDGKSIRTLTVKVRYNDMDEQQASESLAEPTDLESDLYEKSSALLHKAWQRRVSLRLVSLKLSNVYEGRLFGGLVLDVSSRRHSSQQRLAGIVDQLREKYGRGVLLRGHDFVLRSNREQTRNPAGERQAALPLPQGEGRGEGGLPNSFARPSLASDYKKAVVERQRLANSIAMRAADSKPSVQVKAGLDLQVQVALSSVSSSSNTNKRISILCRRPQAQYTPLNVHSYYSFLDSTLSVKGIIDLAKRHQLPAIALTDKNNLHGAVEFAQSAAEAGIKPIIGTELECEGHRVLLYVENQTGYQNLCRILTQRARERGCVVLDQPQRHQSKQRQAATDLDDTTDADPLRLVDDDTAALRRQAIAPRQIAPRQGFRISDFGFLDTTGLIAVSSSAALSPFFADRFYLATNSLEAYEKRFPGLPCVPALPVRYELPAERWKYNIVQSIRTLTLLKEAHPKKTLAGDEHFRTAAEMAQLFGGVPGLLAHSREIAERCTFQFSLGKPQFPSYRPDDGSPPAAYLRRLVMEGLQRRYPKNHAQLKLQLEEELAIITEVGYEEYFLVMWDILQECRRRGIDWITRGSAADSLACYCLEISGVCPIRFDLYFRRFLNKDRMALNKLPDIDVDFPHDRKDDVIDLIFEKYKTSNTAVVGGFSTFQARSAFAEVAKVLGVSEFQVRRITERFPHFARSGELSEAVAETQECRELPLADEPYATALKMGQFLDGFPRYPKMHPCGLVLSRQPMHEITPCFISAKGYPTTHFDMDSVEAVGLVKMDILAQGGLAVMRDVLAGENPKSEIRNPKQIRRPKSEVTNETETAHPPQGFGFRISDFGFPSRRLPQISDADFHWGLLEPWNDPEVWSLIASGNARAVHHIESPAMISLCKMCNVRDIDTLIAIVSVIRPGAANESKKMEFARRYQRLSPTRYLHPSLEPCLRSTYGLVVYEEHILQICEAFAGLPPGRADVLRRALGKNKSGIIAQIETEFADCARRQGRTEAEIKKVWDLVVGFRGYAFCKAHSTAYGVEAYQSAWLKRYYPAQFMAAVLTNGKGFYSPLVYVLECHRLGLPFLPPSINHPGPAFGVERLPKNRKPKTEIRNSIGEQPPGSDFNLRTPFGFRISDFGFNLAIRAPVLQVKGLSTRTKETILSERTRGPFLSLVDFFLRVRPLPEDMEALIRIGAFDEFAQSRTTQYWQFKSLARTLADASAEPRRGMESLSVHGRQLWLLPPANLERLGSVPLNEPDKLERLRAEEELLGYAVSGHPLELFPNIAWETYCPINRLGEYLGQQVVTCGLVIEQRLFHQVTGEPMKFITIADRTGIIETELFAKTYKSYGLNTVRYRVLEITATVEPFENGRGHTLRVLRAGKPRERGTGDARHLANGKP